MDISLRMWLFIILGVLILGILIDGIRQWRQHQRNPYRLSLGAIKIDSLPDDPFRHEFPSGGPRPVDPVKLEPFIKEEQLNTHQEEAETAETSETVETAETVETEVVSEPAKSESFFVRHTKPKVIDAEKPVKSKKRKAKSEQLDLTSVPILTDPIAIAESGHESFEAMEDAIKESDNLEGLQPLFSEPEKTVATKPTDEENEIQEAIVVNVFSRDAKGFQGEPLLEVLLGCSLRYGDMSIFHRHQSPVGEGKVLFSVANAMNPGTFKIEAMNKFSTKGLSFFFGLPGPNNPIETFDLMLQTAQYLAKRLDGELKDDKRSVLTGQTIEHYRQRIRDFERRHLVQ